MLSDWLAQLDQHQAHPQVGWLSLDDEDNDLTRFLTTWSLPCAALLWALTRACSNL